MFFCSAEEVKTGILIVSESLLVTRCVARSKPIDLALPGGKFCFSNCAVVVSRARVNGALIPALGYVST